jgi:azurin
MKTIFFAKLLAAVLLTTASLLAVPSETAPVKNVLITANDNMKYSLTRIEATPGQTIHVELKNEGTLPKAVMAHNWILLKLGADPTAYAAAALMAKDEGYEPKSLADKVLAAIPLVGANLTGEITFEAPAVPGSYPFLCSFPAHCQIGMRGELVVK